MHVSEPRRLLPQNGIVLELCRTAATQNHHSCQLIAKQAEGGYYDESDIVLYIK